MNKLILTFTEVEIFQIQMYLCFMDFELLYYNNY